MRALLVFAGGEYTSCMTALVLKYKGEYPKELTEWKLTVRKKAKKRKGSKKPKC